MVFFEFCRNDFVSEYLKISPVAIVDLQKVNNFVIREKKRNVLEVDIQPEGLN